MSTDHDQRFKTILKEFFPEFMQLFFADMAHRLDFDRVDWLEQQLFADPPVGSKHAIDLLAQVPYRPSEDASPDPLILIHIEIESDTTVEPLRRRMFDYWYELSKKHPNMPIQPIAVYLNVGLDGIGIDQFTVMFHNRPQMTFLYDYVGLSGLRGEDYLNQSNPLAVGLSALMRIPSKDRVRFALAAIARVLTLDTSIWRRYLLVECVQAYAPLEATQKIELTNLLEDHQGVGAMVKTFTETLIGTRIEDGIKAGVEAGIAERMQQIEAAIALQQAALQQAAFRGFLTLMLERKFGSLSAELRERILTIPGDQLDAFGRRALDANSEADLV